VPSDDDRRSDRPDRRGLPVGLQIIGAEGEDRTTIEFAGLLVAEIGGFVPPPG